MSISDVDCAGRCVVVPSKKCIQIGTIIARPVGVTAREAITLALRVSRADNERHQNADSICLMRLIK